MLHAVKGLIGAPQNNFRISKNGRIVYDEKQEKSVFNRILKELFPRDGRTKEEYVVKSNLLGKINKNKHLFLFQKKNHFYESDKGDPAEGFLHLRGTS